MLDTVDALVLTIWTFLLCSVKLLVCLHIGLILLKLLLNLESV